ncbi:hypothetical protein M9H77_24235 [Catharanthus roseus]|uniref:Uncharacterized protein n=1 Tax=Catharanthus roseus TaxID=4058 RepID=A0ACC0AWS3_CATRO|nr:hypothetical protein M9H77_24235 [Catharanthus roseus]
MAHIKRAHPSYFANLTTQTQFSGSASASGNPIAPYNYNSELIRRELVRWVSIGKLPLSLPSNHLFVRFVQTTLQPAYKGFPRISLRKEILKIRNIIQIRRDYIIDNRIFTIYFDNASNNDASISMLKNNFRPILDRKLFHIRCTCHILNLCIQEGFSHVEHVTNTIRGVLKLVRSSDPRQQHFKSLCREHKISYKCFDTDVTTRWNLTLDMLQTCFSL